MIRDVTSSNPFDLWYNVKTPFSRQRWLFVGSLRVPSNNSALSAINAVFLTTLREDAANFLRCASDS